MKVYAIKFYKNNKHNKHKSNVVFLDKYAAVRYCIKSEDLNVKCYYEEHECEEITKGYVVINKEFYRVFKSTGIELYRKDALKKLSLNEIKSLGVLLKENELKGIFK